ncbi:MAG TPA: hypothetical protein VD816_16140 [Ohtaekwangia sp.]|nr:hypothetical protein [Ohtaekwangia sp.]
MRTILSCICLVAVGSWFTACDDDDDKKSAPREFTLDDTKYALTDGYLDSVRTQTIGEDIYHFWNVVMTSDGISYDAQNENFTGTGDAVRFDLYTTQEGVLPDGTYAASDLTNGIESAGVFIAFSPQTGTGTAYDNEISDGSVTVSRSGNEHVLNFTLVLEDQREIKGSWQGNLTRVEDF